MRKQIAVIAVLACLSLPLLGGCFPSGKPAEKPKGSAPDSGAALTVPVSAPATLQKELVEGVTIDATVSVPDTAFSYAYTAVPWVANHEELSGIFLKGKENIEYKEARHPETGEIIYRGYLIGDNSGVAISYQGNVNTLSFIEKIFGDYPYTLSMYAREGWIRSDFREKFPKQALDNIDKEQAVALVKEKLDALRVPILETPEVYCLDLESLQKDFEANWKGLENPKYPDGKHPEWKKEHEAYVVAFHAALPDGSPVTRVNYRSGGIMKESVFGSRCVGVVGQAGLININVNGVYEIQEQRALTGPVISLDAACERVAAKHESVILAGPIKIQEIRLEYVPRYTSVENYEFEIVPVWIFQGTQEKPDEKGSVRAEDILILIDAVTGEEFPNVGVF